ncbi:Rossmann-like and DUF2520 domain-containing protein [Caldisalinibacter kiritimatiensis]|uniref:DUF2520 domain-containing protein n=1 Tax=Caldisalinibacter kiritimatiensis TaxID=1304284 RepID=R1CP22_9FIRM|nr:Rossmann-like and DUF2520 domain-containing protein [Caldisalinibacter kiritimatiensis]EOD00446.1 hypothetical protein L21TH_1507 [Caldisalinibacter kiritimatiensis]
MRIGFIGAGKVGTAFGKYLKKYGFKVYGYYSRTYESALKAAKYTDTKAVENIEEIVVNTDIIFITTKDDEIRNVSNRLVQKNLLIKGKILIHMSGAASSDILIKAKEQGSCIYSLHPLQSFADIDKAVKDLEDTIFSLEGDEEKINVIEDILKKTDNEYFKLNANQKSIYHAAACVVSNYLVTLMDYGLSLFESIGIDKEKGFKALLPLIDGTLKNIYDLGTEKALTGPIARGDTNTIERHLKSMQENNLKSIDFYKLLGAKTVDLAKKEKLENKEKITYLKNILKEV